MRVTMGMEMGMSSYMMRMKEMETAKVTRAHL